MKNRNEERLEGLQDQPVMKKQEREEPVLRIYGTLGPSCHEQDLLEAMMESGMNGIRFNLSHGMLKERKDWIENLKQAKKKTGMECSLVMDLHGRERRLGQFEPYSVLEDSLLSLKEDLCLPSDVIEILEEGDELVIADECWKFQVVSLPDSLQSLEEEDYFGLEGENHDHLWALALQDCQVEPGKSLRIRNKTSRLPVLDLEDLENLKDAKEAGVTGVMVPFVHCKEDLERMREALKNDLPEARLMAKIEDLEGVFHIDEILEEADEIIIARGDLAASCQLENLPLVQTYLMNRCRKAEVPFMIVTQMLESMRENPSPTRPEVCGIFQAVLDGAHSIMLTGETASGKYPLAAMEIFCRIASQALVLKEHPEKLDEMAEMLKGTEN